MSCEIDILKILKELKSSDYEEISFKCGDIEINLLKKSKQPEIQPAVIMPETHEIEESAQEEDSFYLEEAKEADKINLEDLMYDPDRAQELLDQGVIVEDGPLNYKYVERD